MAKFGQIGQYNRRQALTGLGRGLLGLGAIGAAGATLSGCASSQDGDQSAAKKSTRSITVGSKGFAESWITGELYAQGLRNLGYTVDLKTNVGSSDIISAALLSGQIDLYPEYTGVMLVSFMGEDRLMDSAEETYELAKTWAEDNRDDAQRDTVREQERRRRAQGIRRRARSQDRVGPQGIGTSPIRPTPTTSPAHRAMKASSTATAWRT